MISILYPYQIFCFFGGNMGSKRDGKAFILQSKRFKAAE